MPLVWRYLLGNYLKILFFATFSLIAILLASRLEEIARFAATTGGRSALYLFIINYIPYIFPIALPLGSVLSSNLLLRRLSSTHELTSFRACRLSLSQLLTPLLLVSAFLSVFNFYIISELSTEAHLSGRKMLHDLTSINPLLLLENAKVAKLEEGFLQIEPVRSGETAKDLLLGVFQKSNQRLALLIAKKVKMREGKLVCSDVTLISSKQGEEFDPLILENQKEVTTSAPELAYLLRAKGWKIANDHLKLSLLRARVKSLKAQGAHPKSSFLLNKCSSELVRRFSIALAPFSFTLLGAAFGIETGRAVTRKKILVVILMTAFFLLSFFAGKEYDHFFWLAFLLFFLPHIIILGASFFQLRRISRGFE